LLRLSRRDGAARLEAACARALTVGVRSYRHVDSILKHGLDRLPPPVPAEQLPLAAVHEHLRGREYYQDTALLTEDLAASGPDGERSS